MRAKLFIAIGALAAMTWAVPNAGTAPFIVEAASSSRSNSIGDIPHIIRLRVNKAQGLLLTSWINGMGPYVFAVDTGADINLITQRVVGETLLRVHDIRPTSVGGLTSSTTTSTREAVMNELALGDRSNSFFGKKALVVSRLAQGVDGILDPTDLYSPHGYSIDMPNQRMEPIYPTSQRARQSGEGAVVSWMRLGDSSRPFVRLGDGRLALIDTGSSFGLAVNGRDAVIVGNRRGTQPAEGVRDIGGGMISSRRVEPTTISIGELVLRRVPTDILFGIEDDAPLILGRDALYPFKITFDPQRRLIEFTTGEKD